MNKRTYIFPGLAKCNGVSSQKGFKRENSRGNVQYLRGGVRWHQALANSELTNSD